MLELGRHALRDSFLTVCLHAWGASVFGSQPADLAHWEVLALGY